jgi:hypothetical protein
VKRHRTDGTSLVFGVTFLVVAIWGLLGHAVHIGFGTLAWAVAVALILIGGLGLLGALRGRDADQNQERQ